jgi:hypothetical protein
MFGEELQRCVISQAIVIAIGVTASGNPLDLAKQRRGIYSSNLGLGFGRT